MFDELFDEELIKIILSNKINKELKFNKIIIKPLIIKNKFLYQFESFTNEQAFHENLDKEQAIVKLDELFGKVFKQIEAVKKDYKYFYKLSNKGKILMNKQVNQSAVNISLEHNKKKNYIINEGDIVKPLIDLGVMTSNGTIVRAKYDKFKQIQRFLEMIEDSIKGEKKLNIIDFGCGKSYLTFILYYYLVEVKKMDVNIVGLDLKEDVISDCNTIKQKYGYHNLRFELGDISLFKPNFDVDMIITLHACNTATDYALYHAINYKCKYIFCVPCCQHEINQQIGDETLEIINKYGLLKEKFSSLLTDGIRANILEYYGYKVQVMEFIDSIHSPKNTLIRCVYQGTLDEEAKQIKEKIDDTLKQFKISQTLYNLTIKG